MYRDNHLSADRIQHAITNDYPGMHATVDLDQIGPHQRPVNLITVNRLLTEFLTPAALLAEDGRCLNPILGVQSESMEHMLGLDSDEGKAQVLSDKLRYQCGRPHFLFGELIAEIGDEADMVSFGVLDHPDEVSLVNHVMVIYKIYNQDEPNTRRPWRLHEVMENSAVKWWSATTDTFGGVYWKMLIFPIGFRFVGNGEFFWIEDGRKFRSYDGFVYARREMMYDLCRKLLQARETGTQISETVEPSEPVKTDGEQAYVCFDDSTSVQNFCEQINKRIAALRNYEGLQNLESYTVTYVALRAYLQLPATGDKRYTVAQVERRISQFERLASLRETYASCFKLMQSEIESVCGFLSINNVRFAEIEIPARHSVPGGKLMEVHQFAYTPQGVVDAHTWLSEEKRAFNEGNDFIRKHFHLELSDGTLRSVKGEVDE